MLADGRGLAHVIHACSLPVVKKPLARCDIAVVREVWLRCDVEVCMAKSGRPRIVVVAERHI
jgi:hypothetical protein